MGTRPIALIENKRSVFLSIPVRRHQNRQFSKSMYVHMYIQRTKQ